MALTTRYLITGASGFIGSHLLKKLVSEKKDVYGLVRPQSKLWRLRQMGINRKHLITADILDYDFLSSQIKQLSPTHIIHLAGYGVYRDQDDDEQIFNTNTIGTLNLLKISRDVKVTSFINTGSVYEYSDLPGKRQENLTGNPRNMYDLSKITTTYLSKIFAKKYHLSICTLRLFTVYGEYEDNRRLVPNVILKVLSGEPPVISSQSIRDFIYIDDVINAFIKASQINNWKGEVLNIGSGIPTKISSLVLNLIKLINPDIIPVENKTKFSPHRDSVSWADITLAKQKLNWNPQAKIKPTLKKLVNWYKTNQLIYEQVRTRSK